MDNTKELSGQIISRKPTIDNPMGLYFYEEYSAVVPWNMSGWVAPINAEIYIVKVNNICTLTINAFNNNNSGATSAYISSGVFRVPKRFLPKLQSPAISLHYTLPVVQVASPLNGSAQILNNPLNPNDSTNGEIRINNGTTSGFSDLSSRPLTTVITYTTNDFLNV
jgi:hypothetical protein